MRALRLVSLFFVYGGLGWMGDSAATLLAGDRAHDDRIFTRVDVRIEPEVVVEVEVRTSGACAFEIEREIAIDLAEGGRLAIAAGAGGLRVEGQPDVSRVVATGRVCASSRALLERLVLTAETVDGDVLLSAHDRDGPRWGGRNETGRIDLVVTMPVGTPLDIADSSGEIVVTGSGHLSIEDSSGPIDVQGALGSVRIADGSGDIRVVQASGDVEISDGSGGIEVRSVSGSVAVRDGSGIIEISQVGADVLISADGSGSIEVREVAGDFAVDRDGSGDIEYSDVAGRVDVPTRERRGDRRR